jgi:hypothetical protein
MREADVASTPVTVDEYGLPTHPPCPFCDGRDTELVSPFGSVLSVAAFWCRGCHTAFELVKWTQAARPPGHSATPTEKQATRPPSDPEGETGRQGGGGQTDVPDH